MTSTHADSGLLTRRAGIEAAITAIVTTALTLIVFGPIWSKLDSPLGTGDMYATYVNAETFGGFGYSTTTQFGFPQGMNLNYAPNLDLTENGFAHLVDVLSGSTFTGINILLFVSFPLVAVLAYLMLRLVGGRGPLAIALATAFSLIPFHFGRGLGHTYLATMYSAVTALTLALIIGLGVLPRISRHPRRSARVGAWLAVAAIVVVTAWSGLYYAAFGLILGSAAVVWRFAHRDRWRDLGLAAAPVLGLGVLAIVGFLPGLLTTLAAPPTQPLAERTPYESVTFAGNLAMALIPAPISQLPGMWRYNEAVYDAFGAAPQLENTALTNYGTWITSACLVVFLVGLAVLSRRNRLRRSPLPLLAYLTVVTVLFFVPWGLNYLVAGSLTPQVRAWNRLVPVLLLLFVAGAVAVLARTRLGRTSAVSVVVAVAVLLVATVEQVLPFRAAYADGAATGSRAVQEARAYAAQLNAAIPADCGVLQLPYVVYPEQGSIEELGDYEHFLHGLVNEDKEFSYGAVKGTAEAVPLQDLGNRFSAAVVRKLVDEGFCAVHVDRRGFTDTAWTWVNAGLRESFGAPVASGDDGTWLAYALPGAGQ